MTAARLIPAFLLICTLLAGCTPSDPQAALEAAVQQLQDNLEAKNTGDVMEQLHPQFSAQQQYDRTWAQRTMAMLFLRHKQVRVIAIGTSSEVDPTYSEKGHTRAEVAVTGAEGLIPDSARHYSVKLEWWLEDGEWKLARLNWE
ncbi:MULTISPECIES: hypothetical protein [unclassified Pseudomonas]|uniref:hypothetical protein n=1 Tax=unclassified Pseudomonas TaxID=196821 RepID=UPI00244AFBEB|nr:MULTISPECIES: hypothetical protein [unclassified Pseudomonas]MDG9925890.1 hypothetical protein [Pseudomonas sp. GD04045]MDH0034870.1 hypothetical protein [Pseudomonas sp. GD04019]